jgi:hypothetical protein
LPEGIQQLVDAEMVTVTQARDAFFPFVSIPAEVRAQLFDAVERAVRDHYAASADERLNLVTLKGIIGGAALPLSKPVTPADADHHEERPLFDGKDHAKKCKCKGPTLLYRHWGVPQTRCFNPEWWNGKQQAARKAAEREEERRQAEAGRRQEEAQRRADEAKANGGDAPPPPVAVEDARTLYPYAVALTDSASDFRRMALLVDPTLLPAESLRVVERWEPHRAAHSLICTDRESLQGATEAGRAARLELIRRLTEERNANEREEAGKLDLRSPDVLADLLTALPHVPDTALARVADQHALTVPPHGIKREDWLALPKRDLQLFARIVVLRARAGTLTNYRDPVEYEAEQRLHDSYNAKLEAVRALVSLPRPAYLQRMESLAERFYQGYGPLAAQVEAGELSEAAGEAIQGLQEIVSSMRALYDEAAADGAEMGPLSMDDVRERFDALAAAYEARHGTPSTVDDSEEGAPAPEGDGVESAIEAPSAHAEGDAAPVSDTAEPAPAPAAVEPDTDARAVLTESVGEPNAAPDAEPQPTATDELAPRRTRGRKGTGEQLAAS